MIRWRQTRRLYGAVTHQRTKTTSTKTGDGCGISLRVANIHPNNPMERHRRLWSVDPTNGSSVRSWTSRTAATPLTPKTTTTSPFDKPITNQPRIRHKNAGEQPPSLSTPSSSPRKFSSSSSQTGRSKKGRTTKQRNRSLTLEERYSRKSPIEHILLRPGMYVGPVERCAPTDCWLPSPLPPPPSSSSPSSPIPPPTMNTTPPSFPLRMVRNKHTTYYPALVKVFDEILVNAFDNRLRPSTTTVPSTSHIHVVIDPGCTKDQRPPSISITNDGRGIPIQIHKEEKMYLPEMLFGHLLTGSNFDDGRVTDENGTSTEEGSDGSGKITGGRHGYGAKLTNVFSKSFRVETYDSVRGKRYCQEWENNMGRMHPPEVTIEKGEECGGSSNKRGVGVGVGGRGDYTTVQFVPDLKKLTGGAITNNTIPSDDYAIMCRRVIDIAGCSDGKISVTLNGIPVPTSTFESYLGLYHHHPDSVGETVPSSRSVLPPSPPPHFHRINARWEVGVGLSSPDQKPTSSSSTFEQISFCNGVATTRGGTHVDAITKQVVRRITDRIRRVYPELADDATPGLVRRHLRLFVNASVENPTFDSQTKECLTSDPSTFGSRFALGEAFLDGLTKPAIAWEEEEDGVGIDNDNNTIEARKGGPGIIERVVNAARGRQQALLLREVGAGQIGAKRTRRRLLSIPKLDDAHLAGTNGDEGSGCTLILTEGDSAKALAVAGLEVIGRDRYGVFPLRGKFLNVREAKAIQLTSNHEVKAVCTILGLDFDEEYKTVEERAKLRYSHVMLMTDQDADGSHIKGLVINFFRHFWPNLLKPAVDDPEGKSFLSSFMTPLLKATKKGKRKGSGPEVRSFFSLAEYNQWRSSLDETESKRWIVKYYKGLGTSTQAEAKEYFRSFEHHHRPFRWSSDDDGKRIDMVFTKSRADERRDWLKNYDASASSTVQDGKSGGSVGYEEFVDEEMIHFSHADNVRSLPSVVDGLKPSQRKVLYACFKRNLTNEIKVAQLTGYCAEHTAYHHGEASLHSTITNMAQDFIGSNNINLLIPSGQFGTRMSGGKDAASPRYIFTSLSPVARLLFPEVDDPLLTYLEDDGISIEPRFFCPILPLLLLNGSQGIGTGWSTSIPSFSARDVWEYVRVKLDQVEGAGSPSPPIRPWVRGFTGKIVRNENGGGYLSRGKIKKLSKTSVLISELPVGRWTNDHKEHLIKMQSKGEIQSFVENHTTSTVSFTVTMKSAQLTRMVKSGLEKVFKLESRVPTTNMHAFDRGDNIVHYDSPEAIADAHFDVRLGLYQERKRVLERAKDYSATMKRNKAKFIEKVINGEIDFVRGKKSKLEVAQQLKELNFQTLVDLKMLLSEEKYHMVSDKDADPEEDSDTNLHGSDPKQFDYLLNLPLSSLTSERIKALRDDAEETDQELISLRNASPEALWRSDLDKLKPSINKLHTK